jgi:Ca2+/Na+ antiporter
LFLVRSKQLLLSKPGINTLGNTSQLFFFSYEREEEYSRVVVFSSTTTTTKVLLCLDNFLSFFFCLIFSFFALSLLFSLFSLSRSPPSWTKIQSSPTNKRPHFYTKTQKHHGESTRGVLLGARMAVREEEQRVRPRVREPNAHVRGERQRDREARI